MDGSSACRLGIHGAAAVVAGTIISGPGALLVVESTYPQPAWRGPAAFAQSYHPVQTLPYVAGFLLLGGFVTLISGLHGLARPAQRPRTTAALICTGVFAALISLNYVVQTSFVPQLARNYQEDVAPLVTALSMTNPASLAWALEMWGYGFLGVATWLVAPVFDRTPLERWVARAFAVNGWMSLAGAACTIALPGWPLTTAGLVAFGSWNLLAATMATLALVALRKRALVPA